MSSISSIWYWIMVHQCPLRCVVKVMRIVDEFSVLNIGFLSLLIMEGLQLK